MDACEAIERGYRDTGDRVTNMLSYIPGFKQLDFIKRTEEEIDAKNDDIFGRTLVGVEG